jgi:hypothetical protein
MSGWDWLTIALLVLYLVFFVVRILKRRGLLTKLVRNIFTNYVCQGNFRQAGLTLQGGQLLDLFSGDEYRQLEEQLPHDPHP